MRNKDPDIPMIIMGDFNAHIKDHYSILTYGNGELLLNITKKQSLELFNMNHPTFEQPGKNPTWIDYVAWNKKGHDIIQSTKTRDEVFTNSDHHIIEITANAQLLQLLERP